MTFAVPRGISVCALCGALLACSGSGDDDAPHSTDSGTPDSGSPDAGGDAGPDGGACSPTQPSVEPVEQRQACADHDPLRKAYFGDLHVHTRLSFDAYTEDVRTTPDDAYSFARGATILIPPLDASGKGTQSVRLSRPLDFAAVTDHSEFLGEVLTCTEPGAPGYGSPTCVSYRQGGFSATQLMGTKLSLDAPTHSAAVCGDSGADCVAAAHSGWQRVLDAAEAAYDRTSTCKFSSLLGYEWTGATGVSNLHRNVIFRDEHAPPAPVTYLDRPTPAGLWTALAEQCRPCDDGCRYLAIPHNSNLSNGKLFNPAYRPPPDLDAERDRALLRAAAEPLVEIFQHKGSSECLDGLSGATGPADPLCDFEQVRSLGPDCGEGTGQFGMIGGGCVSRWDFVRGVLLGGLLEEKRVGINPYRLGIIASTDTHVGTPGATDEENFTGHIGTETTPETRLGTGEITTGIVGNPGGLVGVWATENSRHALFDALARREAFGTSGTRIVPRVFGGWALDAGLCSDAALVAKADAAAVPMGGVLPASTGAAGPTFVIAAERDADPAAGDLERVQVIKGWTDAAGAAQFSITDVAVAQGTADVDLATCARTGSGAASLCQVWTDPSFDPALSAFWYVRVVEQPSCRWSWRQCLALPAASRPAACTDPKVPHTVHERAWTSPIWYSPP